jgi:hypothetical protein
VLAGSARPSPSTPCSRAELAVTYEERAARGGEGSLPAVAHGAPPRQSCANLRTSDPLEVLAQKRVGLADRGFLGERLTKPARKVDQPLNG